MSGENAIKSLRKFITGFSINFDFRQSKRIGLKFGGRKVIVRDGIPPCIHFQEQVMAAFVLCWPLAINSIPKLQIKPVKVGADGGGLRILGIKLTMKGEVEPKKIAACVGRRGLFAKVIGRLGVKIPAIALEMAGDEHEIGMVDLKRRIAAAALASPNRGMGVLDFIQRRARFVLPIFQRFGGHPVRPEMESKIKKISSGRLCLMGYARILNASSKMLQGTPRAFSKILWGEQVPGLRCCFKDEIVLRRFHALNEILLSLLI